jgi:hypothetical protein
MTVAAKAAAALLLLTVSMAAADTPATVADALAELKVTAFSRALNQVRLNLLALSSTVPYICHHY